MKLNLKNQSLEETNQYFKIQNFYVKSEKFEKENNSKGNFPLGDFRIGTSFSKKIYSLVL